MLRRKRNDEVFNIVKDTQQQFSLAFNPFLGNDGSEIRSVFQNHNSQGMGAGLGGI